MFTNTSSVTHYKTDGRVLSSTMAPNTMFSFCVNSKLAMCTAMSYFSESCKLHRTEISTNSVFIGLG